MLPRFSAIKSLYITTEDICQTFNGTYDNDRFRLFPQDCSGDFDICSRQCDNEYMQAISYCLYEFEQEQGFCEEQAAQTRNYCQNSCHDNYCPLVS
jgi:hypothetical protein